MICRSLRLNVFTEMMVNSVIKTANTTTAHTIMFLMIFKAFFNFFSPDFLFRLPDNNVFFLFKITCESLTHTSTLKSKLKSMCILPHSLFLFKGISIFCIL